MLGGPEGCKKALMSAILRLVEPHGIVRIDGLDVSEMGLHDLREKISVIQQVPAAVLFLNVFFLNGMFIIKAWQVNWAKLSGEIRLPRGCHLFLGGGEQLGEAPFGEIKIETFSGNLFGRGNAHSQFSWWGDPLPPKRGSHSPTGLLKFVKIRGANF